MDYEKKYAELVKALTKNSGVVQPFGKKGFGRNGLYFKGRLFAFLSYRKKLILKLEPARVKDLVAAGMECTGIPEMMAGFSNTGSC